MPGFLIEEAAYLIVTNFSIRFTIGSETCAGIILYLCIC